MGRNVSVLDNATVRGSKGAPTRIGDEAVISPGATVTSAEIGDGAMIGMGAVVSAGAKVGNDAFVDAGAVVAPGTVIPPGQLWTGAPARFLRALSPEEMKYVRSLALEYAGLSQRHFDQGQKDVPTLEEEAGWADYKVVKGMEPSDAMPTADPDVVRYYELTAAPADSGVFRAEERNLEGASVRPRACLAVRARARGMSAGPTASCCLAPTPRALSAPSAPWRARTCSRGGVARGRGDRRGRRGKCAVPAGGTHAVRRLRRGLPAAPRAWREPLLARVAPPALSPHPPPPRSPAPLQTRRRGRQVAGGAQAVGC